MGIIVRREFCLIPDKKSLKGLLFDKWGVNVFLFSDNNLMNEEVLLNQLEELAEKLEILVRDENINIEESSSAGGLCRVEGKYIVILHSKSTVKEKIQVMIEALQQFDLSDMYIKPVIRELLEGSEK